MPPGPSSALPESPAQIPSFPRAGDAEQGGENGQPACHREDCAAGGTRNKSQPLTEVTRSDTKKQKNMLARASPVALHLKMQQLNGLDCPSQAADLRPHSGGTPDTPRPSDSCESGREAAPAARNSERCQHEGRGPFSENGSHSLLVNNSMNGVPGFSTTDAVDGDEEKADIDQMRTPGDVQPGGPRRGESTAYTEPPAAQLARLDLSSSPCRAEDTHDICYVRYESELQMPWIMRLITKDLSEPYSIYTYRYFIHNWPQLCFLVSRTAVSSC